jgi:hypothetical protein
MNIKTHTTTVSSPHNPARKVRAIKNKAVRAALASYAVLSAYRQTSEN